MSDYTYRRLAAAVLTAHQRYTSDGCLCGWAELGRSHADHVAEVLDAAGALRGSPDPFVHDPPSEGWMTCHQCGQTYRPDDPDTHPYRHPPVS